MRKINQNDQRLWKSGENSIVSRCRCRCSIYIYIYIYIYMRLSLTHLPLVPSICVNKLDQHWFRYRLVAYSAPSHYLYQYWVIVNGILKNKLHWNLNQNTSLSIHENAYENIVCEIAAILSRGRWVKVGFPNMGLWDIIICQSTIVKSISQRYRRPITSLLMTACFFRPVGLANGCVVS